MKLEICANSFESALAAQEGGAHRIELCQELSLGGITPSHGLMKKVVQELEIPVFVLIRPRSGDFTYSDSEYDVMLRDVAYAKELGVKGIVSGVLYPDLTIDVERTQHLIKMSGNLPFTFHRAFDWTPDPAIALEILVTLGVQRVLTSGQAQDVVTGFEMLQSLLLKAANRIEILPGGGISIKNVTRFKEAGFNEVHGSLSQTIEGYTHHLSMSSNSTINAGELIKTDIQLVKKIMEFL